MLRPLLVTLAGCLSLVLLMPTTTLAFTRHATLRDSMIEEGRAHAKKLAAMETTLRASAPDDWSELQIQDYLTEALWTVHYAVWAASFGESRVPDDPSTLLGTQYCSAWPANPFNNWEPMAVLGAADPFSAGDITYQICPPDFYSFINDELTPLGFQLGVYGPSPEFAAAGSASTLDLNTWATVPPGTLYMTGAYGETAEATARKIERRRAQQKAE